jgi:hypothetical protein
MAGYNNSVAYDLSLFEPQIIEKPKTKNNAVPVTAPKRQAANKASAKTETRQNRNSAQVALNPAVFKAVMLGVMFCLCVVALLIMESKCNALDKQISNVQNELSIAQGETVRLNAELNGMISTEKIENYAENVLGMVKAESYQISYIDLSEGDKIVVSGDRTLDENGDITNKIKELFAYIF